VRHQRGRALDRLDDRRMRHRVGGIVQGHGDDQALTVARHGEPGSGRAADRGHRAERGANLGEQRHRVGRRVTDAHLAGAYRGQVADALRVDGHAGLGAGIQRDARFRRQQPGEFRRAHHDVRRHLLFAAGCLGRHEAAVLPRCHARRGRERGHELRTKVGDRRQEDGRAVGHRPVAVG